jgi:hypothetical protein
MADARRAYGARMTPAIKLHTHLAPSRKLRRLTEEEKLALLVKAREEIDKDIPYAVRLIELVIEELRT